MVQYVLLQSQIEETRGKDYSLLQGHKTLKHWFIGVVLDNILTTNE